jgi:hypothetical protein
MKEFAIYRNPLNQFEAVKRGFSWPGFFFTVIWAFVKKMWSVGLITIGGLFVIGFMMGLSGADETTMTVMNNFLSLVVAVVFGVYGNKLRESNLGDRGYDPVDTVIANTPEGAISVHLRNKK